MVRVGTEDAMRVAVIGAGSIGLGSAAVLGQAGHSVALWGRALPPGPRTVVATGAVAGTVPVASMALEQAVRGADAVLVTVPGFAHRAVMDLLAPALAAGQPVIVSSHCSFSGHYLARRLPGARVAAWGTTVVTGRRTGPFAANVSNLRAKVDVAGLPAAWGGEALALCAALFGDRFVLRDDLVAIALSNLNPQNHMAMALCNLTRIERAEDWGNYWGITGGVGRMMEALDAERLAIAAAYGVQVRTIFDHFALSFGVERAAVAAMAAAVHGRGGAPLGPKDLSSRYVTEDVPFGLVPTEALGRAAGVPTPLHTAGIELLSAALGRDFRAENDLLPPLGLAGLDAGSIRRMVQ
jgi:opine dehydrogenase